MDSSQPCLSIFSRFSTNLTNSSRASSRRAAMQTSCQITVSEKMPADKSIASVRLTEKKRWPVVPVKNGTRRSHSHETNVPTSFAIRKDKSDDDVIEQRQGTCPKITATGNCSPMRKMVAPHGKLTGNWRSLVVISWQTHLRQTNS